MIHCEEMGLHPQTGRMVHRYTLQNASGAYAEISTLGGCWMSMHVPDRDGKLGDVLLGFNTLDGVLYIPGYMGMLIGRYGNRIGGAAFDLNGKHYTLAKNNGENHLHGGLRGFNTVVWDACVQDDALVLSMVSPDGDEGYPGTMQVQVTYRLSEDNALSLAYRATCDQDTIINLTNHAYFNLGGLESPSIENHVLRIDADAITAVADSACIPTGQLMPVENTPFDLRAPRRIGEGLSHQQENAQMTYGNGYDHNFVVNGWDGTLRNIATLWDHESGRRMDVDTDQPGVQLYTGNGIKGEMPGKRGVPYQKRQGLCMETQHFPDSIHHENFPSCILRAGDTFESTTVYRFSVE